MTNENTRCRLREPFLLKPCGKSYLWGGQKLNDDFAKQISLNPLAETWECATHPDGTSIVFSGAYRGQSLKDVLAAHPDYIGTHWKGKSGLPILVKLIDAKEQLSIQVHPDDCFAARYENGQSGKVEFWYILDAADDSKIAYGLRKSCTKAELTDAVSRGTLPQLLQYISVKAGDLFYIPPGTIHSIGSGCVVAEVQQNSNLTYRLYDYQRRDVHGRRRELHLQKALSVANLTAASEPRQPVRVMNYRQGYAREFLARCKYFEIYRLRVHTERIRNPETFWADESSCRIILCLRGCGCMIYSQSGQLNSALRLFRGDCVFIPANSVQIQFHGSMEMLDIRI